MNLVSNNEFQAQIVFLAHNLSEEMDFFKSLGFRLDHIYPDDDPSIAVMSGHGLRISIERSYKGLPVTVQLLTDDEKLLNNEEKFISSPGGNRIQYKPRTYILNQPKTEHKFEVRQLRDQEPWIIGRAGMMYRDLIPGRLGGGIMASHIRIPKGGPVPDMVHYHTIGFQLIFCYKGWVRLVYEDQGPEFILNAGDCVTQPPKIRHRVLEASENLEVIEIGVPAEHMTSIDHEMDLPTPHFRPDRKFYEQTFCHHKADQAKWSTWINNDFQYRDTGITVATDGIASVHIIKANIENGKTDTLSHNDDILFRFIMKGKLEIDAENGKPEVLKQGDAFVIPPGLNYNFQNATKELELLEVCLH